MAKQPEKTKISDLTPEERKALVESLAGRLHRAAYGEFGTNEKAFNAIAKEMQGYGDSDLVNEIDAYWKTRDDYTNGGAGGIRELITDEFSGEFLGMGDDQESKMLNAFGYAEDDLFSDSAQEGEAGDDVGKSNYAKFGPGGTVQSDDVEQEVFEDVAERDTGIVPERSIQEVRPDTTLEKPGEKARRETKEAEEELEKEAATLDKPAPEFVNPNDRKRSVLLDAAAKGMDDTVRRGGGHGTMPNRLKQQMEADAKTEYFKERKEQKRKDREAETQRLRKGIMDANADKMSRLWEDPSNTSELAEDYVWGGLSDGEQEKLFQKWNLTGSFGDAPTLDEPATVETGLIRSANEVAPTQEPETFTVPGGQDLSDIPSGEDLRVDLSKPLPPDPAQPAGGQDWATDPDNVLYDGPPVAPEHTQQPYTDPNQPQTDWETGEQTPGEPFVDPNPTLQEPTPPRSDWSQGSGMPEQPPVSREHEALQQPLGGAAGYDVNPYGPMPWDPAGGPPPELNAGTPAPPAQPDYSDGTDPIIEQEFFSDPPVPAGPVNNPAATDSSAVGWETSTPLLDSLNSGPRDDPNAPDLETVLNSPGDIPPSPVRGRGGRGRTSDGPDSAYVPGSESQYTPPMNPVATDSSAVGWEQPAPAAPTPKPFDPADNFYGPVIMPEDPRYDHELAQRNKRSLANPAPAPQYPNHYFPKGIGNERETNTDPRFGERIPVYGKNGITGYQTRGVQEKAMAGRGFRRLNPDGSEYQAPEQPTPGGDPARFQRGYEESVARDRKIPMRTVDDNARRVARHNLSMV
jgi:hypothetical protein